MAGQARGSDIELVPGLGDRPYVDPLVLAGLPRTGNLGQPDGYLCGPVEAVAVHDPVAGQDLLALGVRPVRHDRDIVAQLDPPGVDRGGQPARVHQFAGFGQVLGEPLHERPERGELLLGPGRRALRSLARHGVVVSLRAVHQDHVLHSRSSWFSALVTTRASPETSRRPPHPGHPRRDYTLDLRDKLADRGRAVEIMTGSGMARAELDPDGPSQPGAVRFLLVLTHGAGGSAGSPDLLAARDAALGLGGLVARVTQPYRVKGARAPGSAVRQDAAWVEIVIALRELAPGVPFVQGGRSNGARVACRTAVAVGARAVIALAFPLQPPGRADAPSRVGELRAAR